VAQSGAVQDLPTPVSVTRSSGGSPRAGAIRPGAITTPIVTAPAGGRGSLVSLRLDLATYFQRPEVKSASEPPK
jgi:hypothetical protein